jgi:hypothetical protein
MSEIPGDLRSTRERASNAKTRLFQRRAVAGRNSFADHRHVAARALDRDAILTSDPENIARCDVPATNVVSAEPVGACGTCPSEINPIVLGWVIARDPVAAAREFQ